MNPRFRTMKHSVGVALCVGCATKSLPPGTPPPEYETRTLEPWSPVDAGAEDAAPPPAESIPTESDAGPLPPTDAGPL